MPPSEPSRYVAANFDHLYAVRWRAYRMEDLQAVRRRIAEMHRILRRPILYLSLIPSSEYVFSDEERDMLTEYLRDLAQAGCSGIHHVIGGEGFVASSRRSIVTQMAMTVGASSAVRFKTHASLEEALTDLATELRRVPEELIADAKARGLAFPQ
jgi:hypothetical protein